MATRIFSFISLWKKKMLLVTCCCHHSTTGRRSSGDHWQDLIQAGGVRSGAGSNGRAQGRLREGRAGVQAIQRADQHSCWRGRLKKGRKELHREAAVFRPQAGYSCSFFFVLFSRCRRSWPRRIRWWCDASITRNTMTRNGVPISATYRPSSQTWLAKSRTFRLAPQHCLYLYIFV